MPQPHEEAHACQFCGGKTYEDMVKMVLNENDQIIVIENVPARVCEGCFEQYFDEVTRLKIDLLRGERFPREKAHRVVDALVFTMDDLPVSEDGQPRVVNPWPYLP